MAGRRQHLLAFLPSLLLLLLAATDASRAQPPAAVPPPSSSSSPPRGPVAGVGGGGRGFEGVPMAERETFLRNLQRWNAMPQAEREAVRQQFQLRREQRKIEAERALADTGLQLNHDQREVFILRYLQERRKLERELREATQTERARRLPEIHARLKREFTSAASPSPLLSPSPSPSPTAGTGETVKP